MSAKDEGHPLDVLAVGAHPDDAELGVGGMLHKLSRRGYRVGILDLTRGELASRGSQAERDAEARKAAEILGLALRENADLPDGGVFNTAEQRMRLIPFLRRLRPRLLLAPYSPDRHPDHANAHALVRDANFFAGVTRVETGHSPYRAPSVLYYCPYNVPRGPDVVIDITDCFETKLEALRAHRSQFHNPDYSGPDTLVASEGFWADIAHRAAHWARGEGVQYVELLFSEGPVALDLPPGL